MPEERLITIARFGDLWAAQDARELLAERGIETFSPEMLGDRAIVVGSGLTKNGGAQGDPYGAGIRLQVVASDLSRAVAILGNSELDADLEPEFLPAGRKAVARVPRTMTCPECDSPRVVRRWPLGLVLLSLPFLGIPLLFSKFWRCRDCGFKWDTDNRLPRWYVR